MFSKLGTMLERFLEAKCCIQHVPKPIQVPKNTYLAFVLSVCYMYSMFVFYVCMCSKYVCTRYMYSMHVFYVFHACMQSMNGRDGRSHFRVSFFWSHFDLLFSKPNERNSLEIMFVWTLARRVQNARNSQEIPFSWTFQFVDAARICLLQAQPMSKCTEFLKNCVHSTPVWPGSK